MKTHHLIVFLAIILVLFSPGYALVEKSNNTISTGPIEVKNSTFSIDTGKNSTITVNQEKESVQIKNKKSLVQGRINMENGTLKGIKLSAGRNKSHGLKLKATISELASAFECDKVNLNKINFPITITPHKIKTKNLSLKIPKAKYTLHQKKGLVIKASNDTILMKDKLDMIKTKNITYDNGELKFSNNKIKLPNKINLSSPNNNFKLTEVNSRPTYMIERTSKEKILGLFKAEINVKKYFDAHSGKILSTKKPWWCFGC